MKLSKSLEETQRILKEEKTNDVASNAWLEIC